MVRQVNVTCLKVMYSVTISFEDKKFVNSVIDSICICNCDLLDGSLSKDLSHQVSI